MSPPGRGQDPGGFYNRRRPLATTLEALQRRYAPARALLPKKQRGTFIAPVDLPEETFATLRLLKVQAFVDALQREGWRLVADRAHPIRLESGACPAFDLKANAHREGYREYVVTAWFVLPDARPLRVELPDWFSRRLLRAPSEERGAT